MASAMAKAITVAISLSLAAIIGIAVSVRIDSSIANVPTRVVSGWHGLGMGHDRWHDRAQYLCHDQRLINVHASKTCLPFIAILTTAMTRARP